MGAPPLQRPYAEVWDLTLDEPRSRLLIADSGSNCIRAVGLGSGISTRWRAAGRAAAAAMAGPPPPPPLKIPGALSPRQTALFSSQSAWGRSSLGIVSALAGAGTRGFQLSAAPVTSASLNGPMQLRLATSGGLAGTLLIADADNAAVRAVNLASGMMTTLAGSGSFAFTPDGGRAAGRGLTRVLSMQTRSSVSATLATAAMAMRTTTACARCARMAHWPPWQASATRQRPTPSSMACPPLLP